jgi:molybdopterin synthase catalytic subunit
MQACDELVERIKAELPIWGKEILDAGESVWKVNS